jgi:hypothetical protein
LTIAYFSGKVTPALKAHKEDDQPDSEPAAEERHGSDSEPQVSISKLLLESCKETNSLLGVLIKKTTSVEGESSRLSVRH